MPIWRYIKLWLVGSRRKRKYFYTLSDSPQLRVMHPPAQEKRNQKRQSSNPGEDILWEKWNYLSRRERDVTALTCLGYTNAQMAARFELSIETIKTYVQNVLHKLHLRNKADLRVLFANWDFSDWERRKDLYR